MMNDSSTQTLDRRAINGDAKFLALSGKVVTLARTLLQQHPYLAERKSDAERIRWTKSSLRNRRARFHGSTGGSFRCTFGTSVGAAPQHGERHRRLAKDARDLRCRRSRGGHRLYRARHWREWHRQ